LEEKKLSVGEEEVTETISPSSFIKTFFCFCCDDFRHKDHNGVERDQMFMPGDKVIARLRLQERFNRYPKPYRI
jgi:hypothetical protein